MTLGERLRELRHAHGLTLRQLGQRCSLSVSYLSDLECGYRYYPSLPTLFAIARAYAMPLADVLAGVEEGSDLTEKAI